VSGDDLLDAYTTSSCLFNPSFNGQGPFGFKAVIIRYRITGVPAGASYTMRIVDANNNNQIINESEGSDSTQIGYIMSGQENRLYDFRLQLLTDPDEGLTSYELEFELEEVFSQNNRNEGLYELDSIPTPLVSTVTMTTVIPEIKVIDFLSSIFKMFNLTAYINENKVNSNPIAEGGIYIQPLQDYYNLGTQIDLTRYVSPESVLYERLLPHKEIEFTYEDPETFLTLANNAVFASEFGNLLWNESGIVENFDGKKYTVEAMFEHMVFEKLTDLGAVVQSFPDNETQVLYGWFVDDNQEPTIGSPLIFYNEQTSTLGDNNNSHLKFAGNNNIILGYNRPSNTLNISGSTIASINFGIEKDEYRPTESVIPQSLFNDYHREYIRGLFSSQARKVTYDAYLPPNILLAINLNDTIIIANREFKIDEMKTNLITGKTKLILTNVTTPPLTIPVEEGEGTLNAAVTTENNEGYAIIQLTWTPADYSGPLQFIIDGVGSANLSDNVGSWFIATLAGVPPREREIQITDGITYSVVVTLTV
jgi:hypothetical protein